MDIYTYLYTERAFATLHTFWDICSLHYAGRTYAGNIITIIKDNIAICSYQATKKYPILDCDTTADQYKAGRGKTNILFLKVRNV